MLGFQRPIGAKADCKEIEFVSAIHQGERTPRKDGSIKAPDVSSFLLSRYGIRVSDDDVQKTIIKGYGGGDSKNECIDLAELTATLLIPFFLKESRRYDPIVPDPHLSAETRASSNSNTEGEGNVLEQALKIMRGESSDHLPALTEDHGFETTEEESHGFGKVLRMILGDSTGSPTPTTVDHEFIRKVLITYGEPELAEDDELVQDMFLAATGGNSDILFNEKTFARAIAGDIQLYDIMGENMPTSNFVDVFPVDDKSTQKDTSTGSPGEDISTTPNEGTLAPETSSTAEEKLNEETSSTGEEKYTPQKAWSAAGIDYVADTHRSKLFTVLLWAFLVMTQHTYLPDPVQNEYLTEECENGSDKSCLITDRILQWTVVTLYYSIGGTIFISIGSMGNSFEANSVWPAIASVLVVATATIAPLVLININGIEEDSSEEYGSFITCALGATVVCLQILSILGFSSNDRNVQKLIKKRGVRKIVTFLQEGNMMEESYAKKAAIEKTRLIVSNAASVHGKIEHIQFKRDKSYSLALLNYNKHKDSHERCGGFRWTWHYIFTWKLSSKEGILIPSKLITANLLQFIMSVFLFVSLLIGTRELIEYIADENEMITSMSGETSNLPQAINISGYVGAVAAFLASLSIGLNYLPAIVTTTLSLRCGIIPSLHDDSFSKYMVAPDSVSKVPGSMFWAIFFAGGATFVVFAGSVFFFVFEQTRTFSLSVASQILGFLIPTIFKLLVLLWLRNKFYAGHYRTRPVAANITGLALQCLDYGLAYGYMWFRGVKLVLVSVYYIGRVDTPLFDASVASIGNFDIDDAPTHFRKLIIAHEAHRHPYIELLGKMYLLKLKYGDEFGKTAGSRWRMIFVAALMPWMRGHRVMVDKDAASPESLDKTKNTEVSRDSVSVFVHDTVRDELTVTQVQQVAI